MSKRAVVKCGDCKSEREFAGDTEWHVRAAIKASGWIAIGRFALCGECRTKGANHGQKAS